MTLERFRELCLKQPGATEQIQWGADAVFKVGGKMFAVACTDAAYPERQGVLVQVRRRGLRRAVRARGRRAGALSGAREVGGARPLGALPDREIAELIGRSYAIVRGGLTKKAQAELDAPGAAAKKPVGKDGEGGEEVRAVRAVKKRARR